MNHSIIDHLLQKYWDAETSIEEEILLKKYFSGEHIHDSHTCYAPLFQFDNLFGKISHTTSLTEEAVISKILEKYWQAESTLDEEILLQNYFNSGQVSDSLRPFLPLFQLQNVMRSVKRPETYKASGSGVKGRVISIKSIRAIAALLVLVLAALFFFKNNLKDDTNTNRSNYVEIDDPQVAYEYTMAALAKVSRNYKRGKDELEVGMNNMNQVNIFKQQ